MSSLRKWKRAPHLGTRRPAARPRLEALEGRWAPAVFTVTSAADSGPGSLRQALLDVNASPGLNTIHFSIGSGPQTIAPSSPLPAPTNPVVLDGTTQPGFAGLPLITLDGAFAGATDGLDLLAPFSGVWGLTVTRFAGCGVVDFSFGASIQGNFLVGNGHDGVALVELQPDFLHGAAAMPNAIAGNLISGNGGYGAFVIFNGNCTIQSNRIGTDATGTAALPNAGDGVFIQPDGHPELGHDTITLNLISGNGRSGVFDLGDTGDLFTGNTIGTDAAGDAALPNGLDGVTLLGGTGDTIGGTAAGQGNLISGNRRNGVLALDSSVAIEGNRIGTNAAGTAAVPNAQSGIDVPAGNNLISANLISGNGGSGVFLEGPSTVVQGNLIGTDASGSAALGNALDGVTVATSGPNTLQGNVISANGRVGVLIGGMNVEGAVLQGNKIGTDASGSAALGNARGGVVIYQGGSNNSVGGTAAGDGNVIAFNGGDGVQVQPFTNPPITGKEDTENAIEGNSIHDNARLGINLVGGVENSFGVTANHTGTATGANHLQNYPVITAVAAGANGGTDVTFTLDSTPSTAFRVEFFANDAPDPSGFGEGQTFLGFATATTDAGGHFAGTVNVPGVVGAGQTVTATATDPAGNTSEFSADFPPPA